jgi:hypothetical protein
MKNPLRWILHRDNKDKGKATDRSILIKGKLRRMCESLSIAQDTVEESIKVLATSDGQYRTVFIQNGAQDNIQKIQSLREDFLAYLNSLTKNDIQGGDLIYKAVYENVCDNRSKVEQELNKQMEYYANVRQSNVSILRAKDIHTVFKALDALIRCYLGGARTVLDTYK